MLMEPIKQMKSMKQLSLAETGFLPKAGKQPRKSALLAETETAVPWFRLQALIEPFYPKKDNGRPPPMLLPTMLRIHFMQQWFGYSDPAMEEALHDVPILRRFAGLDAFEDVMHHPALPASAGKARPSGGDFHGGQSCAFRERPVDEARHRR